MTVGAAGLRPTDSLTFIAPDRGGCVAVPKYRPTLPLSSMVLTTQAIFRPRWLQEKGQATMAKKVTGPRAAKAASKVLRDGRTSKASKTAAGSALSQREKGKKR